LTNRGLPLRSSSSHLLNFNKKVLKMEDETLALVADPIEYSAPNFTEMGLLKPASWKQYIKQTPEEIMDEKIKFEEEIKDLNLFVSRVKRDPDGFHEEMIKMIEKFYIEYADFKRNPTGRSVRLARLSIFLCQVFEYYRGDLKFLVETISSLLETYAGQMTFLNREKCLQCLIILSKKGFWKAEEAIKFYTRLLML